MRILQIGSWDWFEVAMAFVVVVVLLVGGWVIWMVASEPTCAERGGRNEFAYMQPLLVGKVMVMSPVYTCKKGDQ